LSLSRGADLLSAAIAYMRDGGSRRYGAAHQTFGGRP
jgi:hypothetical protein